MSFSKITIASRKSILAMWQSEHIKSKLQKIYKNLEVDIIKSSTKGDRILDTPLALIGGKGLFTKEIEDIMLDKRAHIAVHSLKDMPTKSQDTLILGAVSKREDARDAFLSHNYKSLEDLPQNATIGTTSLRRGMQLRLYRKDFKIISLRGNLQSRLEKLKNGNFDAIILAYAGIKRLDLLNSVKNISAISPKILIPSMGQGALGIETRNENDLLKFLAPLNDKRTYIHTYIERSFVNTLNGGCQAPIGVYAYDKDEKIHIDCIVGLMDASKYIKKSIIIDECDYKNAGINLAKELIKQGALDMIEKSKTMFEESTNN